MLQNKSTLIYGCAIFSMFFGSGNLVFPIEIGYLSGSGWIYGFLGLFITGIILPFLGLLTIKLHRGNYLHFFGEAGTVAKFVLPLFILSLMGCFGVVPRCITVAHGGIDYLWPDTSLSTFSIIFCIITFILCLKEKIMVNVLGKWLSPLLLVALAILVTMGVLSSTPIAAQSNYKDIFLNGFLTGYQTMDLFAAFFFSALIFNQIQLEMPKSSTPRQILYAALKPSLMGTSLLAIVYLGFVFLGAHFGYLLENVPAESKMAAIAYHTMGPNASIIIAVVIILSCLTTALALTNIYARYLCTLLHLKDSAFPVILAVTIVISYYFSLFDFQGIVSFLGPILKVTYPGIIALTLLSLMTPNYLALKRFAFYGITLVMLLTMVL